MRSMHMATEPSDLQMRTLPERLTMRCTKTTPTKEAPMQHSPNTSANCRFSWWPKPKDSAADEEVKRTMSVEVAAAACGWMPNSSKRGFTMLAPLIPNRPAKALN